MHEPFDHSQLAGLEAALLPYAWRRMTIRAVARLVVEAIDADHVIEADDSRVWFVEHALSGCRWRGLTVAGVGRHGTAALQAWRESSRRLDAELARLLDG